MIKSLFMRRAAVLELLGEYGVSAYAARELLENGAIKKLKLPGRKNGYSLYSRAQIERDVLGKLEGGK